MHTTSAVTSTHTIRGTSLTAILENSRALRLDGPPGADCSAVRSSMDIKYTQFMFNKTVIKSIQSG